MSVLNVNSQVLGNQIEVTWKWDHAQPCAGVYVFWNDVPHPHVFDASYPHKDYFKYTRDTAPITWKKQIQKMNQTYFIVLFIQYSHNGQTSYVPYFHHWKHVGRMMQIHYQLTGMTIHERNPQLVLSMKSFLNPSVGYQPIPTMWIELDALKGNRRTQKIESIHLSQQAQQTLFAGEPYTLPLNYAELSPHLPFSFRLNTDSPVELHLQPQGNMSFNYTDGHVTVLQQTVYNKIVDMVNRGNSFNDIYRSFMPSRAMAEQLYQLNWQPRQLFYGALPQDEGFDIWLAIVHYLIYYYPQWYVQGLEWLKNNIQQHKNEQQINRILQIMLPHGIQRHPALVHDFMVWALGLSTQFAGQRYLMQVWLEAYPDEKLAILRGWLDNKAHATIAFGLLVDEVHNHAKRDDFSLLREVILAVPDDLDLTDCLNQYVRCQPFEQDVIDDMHKWLGVKGLLWTARPEPYLACATRFAEQYIQHHPFSDGHSKAFFNQIIANLRQQPPPSEPLPSLLRIVATYIKRTPFLFEPNFDTKNLSEADQKWRQSLYNDLKFALDNILFQQDISDETWVSLVELGMRICNPTQADTFLRHWESPTRVDDILRIMNKSHYPITPKVVKTLLKSLNHPDTSPSLRHVIYQVLLAGYLEEGEAQFTEFGDAIMGYMRLKGALDEGDVAFWHAHYLIERVPALINHFADVHLALVIKIWEKLPHPEALSLLIDEATKATQLAYLKAHVPQTGQFNIIHELINTRLQQDIIERRRQEIVRQWADIHDQIGGGIPKTLSAGGSATAYRQFVNLYEQANTASRQFAPRLQAVGNDLNRINDILLGVQQLRLDVQRVITELNLQNQAQAQQRAALDNAQRTIQDLNRQLDNLGAIENDDVNAQLAQVRQANLDAIRRLIEQLERMMNANSTDMSAYRDQLRQLQIQEQAYINERNLLDQHYRALNEENNRASARIALLSQFSATVQALATEIGRNHDDKQETTQRINELRNQWRDNFANEIPIQIDAVREKRFARHLALRERANRLNQPTNPDDYMRGGGTNSF